MFADFCTSKNFGVNGRLWLELKVFAGATWDQELANCKKELEDSWGNERSKDASLGGVLLLAAKVGACAGGTWTAPTLFAALQTRTAPSAWQVVAGGSRRAARGRCQATKPALATLWGKMEWLEQKKGTKVGLLKHFLAALGLPAKNPGQRATTFNSLLKRSGCHGRVFNGSLKGKCGRSGNSTLTCEK